MQQTSENGTHVKRTSTPRAVLFGLALGLTAALGVQFGGAGYWLGVLAGLIVGITFMFGPGNRIR